jgi:hypothetical protein
MFRHLTSAKITLAVVDSGAFYCGGNHHKGTRAAVLRARALGPRALEERGRQRQGQGSRYEDECPSVRGGTKRCVTVPV